MLRKFAIAIINDSLTLKMTHWQVQQLFQYNQDGKTNNNVKKNLIKVGLSNFS